MRIRFMAILALAAAGVAAAAVMTQADQGPDGLGRSDKGDRFAEVVPATPTGPPDGARATPPRREGIPGLRRRVGVMKRSARAGDELPAWVVDAPGVKADAESARRIEGTAGTPPMWVATDAAESVVVLAGEGRASWFYARDLLDGRVLRVDEQIESDDRHIAVTGLLPDGVSEVSIKTNVSTRRVALDDGVYSETFEKTLEGLPRVLRFRDDTGMHELDVPLSPDMPR